MSLSPMERAKGMAAQAQEKCTNRYMPSSMKKTIRPSKCRLPLVSIITRGFRKYQKIS